MNPFHEESARRMYMAAFHHVEMTGHSDIIPSDSPPLIGLYCRTCKDWWTSPLPRAGQYDQWPHGLHESWRFSFKTAEGRRGYLIHGVNSSMAKRGPPLRGLSIWGWLRSRSGVGW